MQPIQTIQPLSSFLSSTPTPPPNPGMFVLHTNTPDNHDDVGRYSASRQQLEATLQASANSSRDEADIEVELTSSKGAVQPAIMNATAQALALRSSPADEDELHLGQFFAPLTQRTDAPLQQLTEAQQGHFQQIIRENSSRALQQAQQQLQQALEAQGIHLDREADIALALTGSDGRRENPFMAGRSLSPMEVIILSRERTTSPAPEEQANYKAKQVATISKVCEVIRSSMLKGLFSDFIEKKETSRPVVTTEISAKCTMMPACLLDMLHFQGNRDVVGAIEEKLMEDFTIGTFRIDQAALTYRASNSNERGQNMAACDIYNIPSSISSQII